MQFNAENKITGAHPHLVLRQSACLVRGDACASAHGLARVQMSDKIVVTQHSIHAEREGHRHRKRQTLRDSYDEDGDGVDGVADDFAGVVEREAFASCTGECGERELDYERGAGSYGASTADCGSQIF